MVDANQNADGCQIANRRKTSAFDAPTASAMTRDRAGRASATLSAGRAIASAPRLCHPLVSKIPKMLARPCATCAEEVGKLLSSANPATPVSSMQAPLTVRVSEAGVAHYSPATSLAGDISPLPSAKRSSVNVSELHTSRPLPRRSSDDIPGALRERRHTQIALS